MSAEKLGVLGTIVNLFSVFKETVAKKRADDGEKIDYANSLP